MNTKSVPAMIMLLAGFVVCVISYCQHYDFGTFVKIEFLTLIGFYLFGCIVKLVLDKGFDVMKDPLSGYEGMDVDEDLFDEMALSDEEYQDDYTDHEH